MNTITKNTSISVGALVVLFSVFSWFTDKIDTKAGKEEVSKVEVKVEKAKDEIDQEENVNIQQQGQIDSTLRLIEKLDKKLDKALE